ncbi:uncharacterized protein PADG_12400 [Paracoccidioides brasiliensis Pb18]|uniref:Uncharacterized protein n=1 Tax=Paracoccidioides brasiliensis (strain Pb18) TaxID=502780 RepID=A0A0A0HSA9_PARBD|nr:uncharacterized protein PADG_12400 [Paracoccidioides brasiliensis Pb18]KGM91542.1 hypothetical protein PADG_12400 [Paracoccidioides brasiliensis Pb18]
MAQAIEGILARPTETSAFLLLQSQVRACEHLSQMTPRAHTKGTTIPNSAFSEYQLQKLAPSFLHLISAFCFSFLTVEMKTVLPIFSDLYNMRKSLHREVLGFSISHVEILSKSAVTILLTTIDKVMHTSDQPHCIIPVDFLGPADEDLWIEHLGRTGAVEKWLREDHKGPMAPYVAEKVCHYQSALMWYRALIWNINVDEGTVVKLDPILRQPQPMLVVEQMKSFAANLTVKQVNAAGHWVQLEARDEINEGLLEFFERVRLDRDGSRQLNHIILSKQTDCLRSHAITTV